MDEEKTGEKKMYCKIKHNCGYYLIYKELKEKSEELTLKLEKKEKIIKEQGEEINRLMKCIKELEDKNKVLKDDLNKTHKRIFKPNISQEEKDKKKKGAPVGHIGISRKKPQRIDEYVDIFPDKCEYCGGKEITICPSFDEHTVSDIEINLKNTTYRKHFGYCHECQKITYPKQHRIIPNSRIGPNASAIAGYFRTLGVPFSKIRSIFKNVFTLDVSLSTLFSFETNIAKCGMPVYEGIKLLVRNSDFIHIDETGWRVDGKNCWLWCFTNSFVVLYHIDRSRGSQVVEKILGKKYFGTIISDCFSAYNRIKAGAKQKCLAHFLRDIKETEGRIQLAGDDKHFCEELKTTFKVALLSHKKYKDDEKSLEELKHIKEEIIDKLIKIVSFKLQNKDAENIRKRVLKHNQELLTFFDKKDVEPTNNFVERQLRPNVISRKVTFGNRSDKGVKNHEVLMSIAQTAKLQGIEPFNIFLQLLTKSQNFSFLYEENIRSP